MELNGVNSEENEKIRKLYFIPKQSSPKRFKVPLFGIGIQ